MAWSKLVLPPVVCLLGLYFQNLYAELRVRSPRRSAPAGFDGDQRRVPHAGAACLYRCRSRGFAAADDHRRSFDAGSFPSLAQIIRKCSL